MQRSKRNEMKNQFVNPLLWESRKITKSYSHASKKENCKDKI